MISSLTVQLNYFSDKFYSFFVKLFNILQIFFLTSLINKSTCWKNPSNPSCIPKYFENTNVIETGLSEFHKMVVTTTFSKLKTNIICYRKYKHFSNDTFRDNLLEELSQAKRRNLCVSLLRKAKRSYYSTLNEKNVIDNWKFWKTVKPVLSNNLVSCEKIILVKNEKIILMARR